MNMDKLHACEPFWNNWYICENGLLGEGSYGSVYRIQREDFQSMQYAALKVISIPKSQSEILQLQELGMSKEEIQLYFYSIVKDIYGEITLMSKVKGKSNIISYEDHEIRERTGEIGFDIFIRMELAESIIDYTKGRELVLEEVLHMGKDLCRALQICAKHNILHRDIKPANIFISKDGDFKLGDFGIAKNTDAYQIGLSIKGSYSYMAPEVYFGKEYDHRADIYSLGIVLYFYLNQKRLPFLSKKNYKITYEAQQEALKRRIAGEQIEFPRHVPIYVRQVVEKAIAFSPKERYNSAEEFYLAIGRAEECMKGSLDLDRTIALDACMPISEFFEEKKEAEKVVKAKKIRRKTQKNKRKIVSFIVAASIIVGCVGLFFGKKYMSKNQGILPTHKDYLGECKLETAPIENVLEVGTVNITVTPVQNMCETTANPKVNNLEKISDSKYIQKKERKEKKNVPVKTPYQKVVTVAPTQIPIATKKAALVPTKQPTKQPNPTPIPVTELRVPSGLQIRVGNHTTLPVSTIPSNASVTITSSNSKIVSVSGKNLYAKKKGSCNILIVAGKQRALCQIQVTE